MGYDIHITRSPNWWDKTDRISHEEWRQVVESDPDLEPYDENDPDEDGYKLRERDFDNYVYYNESCGTINMRPGFRESICKAVEIASKLGAVVQGDEGEFYRVTERGVEKGYEQADDSEWELVWGPEAEP
jgi:hypothetical protein